MKKTKLKNLLNKLSGTNPVELEGFKKFDEGIAAFKSQLQETIKLATLDEVKAKIKGFAKLVDPLSESLTQLKTEIESQDQKLRDDFEEQLSSIRENESIANASLEEKIAGAEIELVQLGDRIEEVDSKAPPLIKLPDFTPQIKEAENRLTALINAVQSDVISRDKTEDIKNLTNELDKAVKQLRSEIQAKGGGSMNRQILVSGVDPLTRYTDINLKPGAGTTITYQNNDTTKKVDITITGGGSGSGITRSIATTIVSSVVGSAASTDYVTLANAGVQVTLPTPVGNTNLYTVKNIGTSSVLVVSTGGETIDGSANLIMPVQYTSVDLISDSQNWEIT